jgi:hypothetical protein
MNRHLARTLMWLYPAWWRKRYAEEFCIFLEECDAGARSIPSIVYSAIGEHFMSEGDHKMKSLQRALALIVFSFVAATLGGTNLVMTADDSPLVSATRSHPVAALAWNALAVAAVLCGVTVVWIAIRLYRSIILYAWRNRRVDIFAWLATPFLGIAVLVLWVAGCMAFAHGQWAPSPWAILANGSAPPSWPSLQTRWICGIISIILIAAVSLMSMVGLTRVVRLTDFEAAQQEKQDQRRRRSSLAISTGLLATGCTLVMFISVLIWGLSLSQSFPNLAQQQLGPLNGSAAASWTISVLLFAVASAVSIRATRSILTGGTAVPE